MFSGRNGSNTASRGLEGLLLGAAAGAVGVWVLDRVDWFLYDREDEETRRRTQRVRPDGLDPAHLVANKVAGAFGQSLTPQQPHPAGMAVHYSIGIAPAALYGAVRHRLPALGGGRGALFGLGLFLLQDEGLNSLTGLSARQRDYPWQDHARGLVAHVAFGVVVDALLGAMNKRARRASAEPAILAT